MPRKPRFQLPGYPQHVVQRGNNRQACFISEQDYHFYLDALEQACNKYGCQVHAYVLMTNHVHLLMTPDKEWTISQVMQSVGRRYVRYINKEYRRSGTLWEGRYKACLVQTGRYLLACYRYIELNPVRAAMVTHPAEYVWSSYRSNAQGEANGIITPHAEYLALGANSVVRAAAYRELFRPKGSTSGGEVSSGAATNTSTVNGQSEFIWYYHPDHLGSTGFVTDANGELYEHTEYFPFGETWVQEHSNTQRTPYLFTGKELDEETQLYYYGARYYDPRTSVWQSADPILGDYLNGKHGMGGVFVSPNLAMYTYTYQNPVKFVDPEGLWPKGTVEKLNNMASYTNSALVGISTHVPVNPVYNPHWGDRCIDVHNKMIESLGIDKELGTQIVGPGSTHARLRKEGYASELKVFQFLTADNKRPGGNATADHMKDSLGAYITKMHKKGEEEVYGLSIMNGFHALTVGYREDEKGKPEINLYDQGTAATGYFSGGHATFGSVEEFNKRINDYVRGHQGERTSKNYQYPAQVEIYTIIEK